MAESNCCTVTALGCLAILALPILLFAGCTATLLSSRSEAPPPPAKIEKKQVAPK